MRILLVNPPETHMITTNVPDFVDMETGKYPPLGLLYVAGSALSKGQHIVEILDCHAEGLDYAGLQRAISESHPDFIGFQATTFTMIDVAKIVEISKRLHPSVPVGIGGPHTWLYPEETLAISGVDYVFLGEGEQNFPLFLERLEAGGDLTDIPGLVFRKDGRTIRTPLPGLIQDLDALPLPPRYLLPVAKYYSVLARHSPITTMMSSRGCPYRCLFCDRPHLGKKWRYRSPENILNEIKACVELGIKEIFFYDDTFNISEERAIKICDLMLQEKIDISWDIRARVDRMTPELILKLARAGCKRIHYGVEAGTPEIVRTLRKEVDLEQVRQIFHATRKAGITTLAYFMIGNPGETREQIQQTIEYALRLNADYAHFSVTTPFPGTDLYRLALEQGIVENDVWLAFARNPQQDFRPPLWEEILGRDELVALLKNAYKNFYVRPGYMIKQALRIRSLDEFKRKTRAGLNLLRKS